MMTNRKPLPPHIPLLEWIASGIGLLLTLAVLGFVGAEALRTRGDPLPSVEVRAERVAQTATGYVVELTAINSAPATAADLTIEGRLEGPGGPAEVGTVTIDYLPGRSERKAGLFFTRDPRQGRLTLRPIGYQQP